MAKDAAPRPGPAALPPFLVRPRYVPKPWGGRRLASDLGRTDLPDGPIGESWEVVDVPGDEASVVDGGPMDGRSIRKALGVPFPLLVKVLDAAEDLSIQVHPDDHEPSGAKEEIWAALSDGGAVATGRLPVGAALPEAGAWMEVLERCTLVSGDERTPPTLVHVPAGTVHALLGGSLVWEVQTPVPVTWRLDDHGRVGLDGAPRPLHHDAARGILARGPESVAHASPDGRRVEGKRLAVHAHPPGTWGAVPGCVLFLAAGGEVAYETSSTSGVLAVPPGRTVVLTPAAAAVTSSGWMLAAASS